MGRVPHGGVRNQAPAGRRNRQVGHEEVQELPEMNRIIKETIVKRLHYDDRLYRQA